MKQESEKIPVFKFQKQGMFSLFTHFFIEILLILG